VNLFLVFKQGLAPIIILFISIFLYLFESSLSAFFIYNRDLINDHQFWRLLTSNFLHTNSYHLFMNLLALILLMKLHIKNFTFLSYTIVFLFCSVGTTLGIYLFAEDIKLYVGLSGVLHGVFVYGVYLDIKKGFKYSWVLMLLVWLKILYEQFFGANEALSELINSRVAIEAHLYGAVSALVCCLITEIYLQYKISKTKNKYS
jgi:rhomboid family GlyGly-CTERM serine protease